MLTVEDAQARILAAIETLAPKHVPILDARGLVLAQDAVAQSAIPPFANSAMDGYAVRAEDVRGASETNPVPLQVIGEAAAGAFCSQEVGEGEAVRIFTGAPLPSGADAVVMQEDTRREGGAVYIRAASEKGRFVRPVGNDVPHGATVFEAGTPLTAAALGMLAAMGRHTAFVHRRPRVAILSTGDELAPPGDPLLPGQIYDCNRIALHAQAQEVGASVEASLHVVDRPEALRDALAGLTRFDAIISSGGVSVGDHDVVKGVLQQDGAMDFWRVAMRPGKPLAFGRVHGVPFFGLPGNPVSSYVTFELFVRPALRKMMGHARLHRPQVTATLEVPVSHATGRREYVRAQARFENGGYTVRAIGDQDSAVMSVMARANCLLIVPEDVERIEAGSRAEVVWLGNA